MTSRAFRERLLKRARKADVVIGSDTADQLESYYRLLARWNGKINLTGFSLAELADHAIDRLLIEPLAASRFVPDAAVKWFDFGSGGGSPAIPLKIVRPATLLTMVESKARKAAFLREAVRSLQLSDTTVEHARIEDIADRSQSHGTAALLTVRAVRMDNSLLDAATRVLNLNGRMLLFTAESRGRPTVGQFAIDEVARLTSSPSSQLIILRRR